MSIFIIVFLRPNKASMNLIHIKVTAICITLISKPVFLPQRRFRQLNLGSTGRNVEKRLLLIPIVYTILRIWNTAEYILLSTPGFNTNPCDESSLRTFFYVITILQVT